MSSPITFSGFNSIDFNVVLNSLMAAASQPLTALQTRQTAIQSQLANLATLTTKVSAVQTAAAALSTTTALTSYAATSTNSAAVAVSAGSGAVAGHYDVVVNELARAQVTASASSAPDADSTTVATGGSLTINGTVVTVTQPATLQQLADAINATSGIAVSASVIQDSPSSFRLVLTATSSGTASAFTVTNNLTGGSGVSFTDTDLDGVSGDSPGDNAVQATDASVLVNNIQVTSASNTLTSVITGATLTLFKKDPAATIGIDVAEDTSALRTKLNTLVSAYNSLLAFTSSQATAAGNGDTTSIGRDPVLRQLRNSLRTALTSQYGTDNPSYLSQIGVEFTRTGTLEVNNTLFAAATKSGASGLATLFAGTPSSPGVFASINTLMTQYTQTSGFISTGQQQLTSQVSRLDDQIAAMQDRLAVQRGVLQREFAAAEAAMAALKNQSGSLASFSTSSLFSPTSSAS